MGEKDLPYVLTDCEDTVLHEGSVTTLKAMVTEQRAKDPEALHFC